MTSMLGSLLKQIVSKMEKIPEEISLPFQEWKEALSGRKRQLLDIVQMLQPITPSYRRFMCIDALGECAALQVFRHFDSLKQILEKSQRTRIFVTGRSHIRAEIERPQVGGGVSVSSTRGDIIRYLRLRLVQDAIPGHGPESGGGNLGEDSRKCTISEMCVGAIMLRTPSHTNR